MHIMEALSLGLESFGLSSPPTIFLQLLEVPIHFDLLAVLDYDVWKENLDGENDEHETLLHLSQVSAPLIAQFPKIASGCYYIIGYINGQDDLHQLIHIPQHVDHISLRITENLDGYQLHTSPGIEQLEFQES